VINSVGINFSATDVDPPFSYGTLSGFTGCLITGGTGRREHGDEMCRRDGTEDITQLFYLHLSAQAFEELQHPLLDSSRYVSFWLMPLTMVSISNKWM
jgi:hypothetical protein